MAKRKTPRPAARARGRGKAAGRTTAAGSRAGGTKSAAGRRAGGATTGTQTADRTRAAGARKAAGSGKAGGTRKAAAGAPPRTPGTRKGPKAGRAPAARAASIRTAAGRAGTKALPRRQPRATGGTAPASGRPKKAAAARGARPGRAPSTPPRRAFGAKGGRSRLAHAERDRRLLEETVQTPPSSLDLKQRPSAARSGRAELQEALAEHTESGPALTAGDIDADWQSAYETGDEAPGGDMPTPDKSVVEEIGTALGVEYQDNEELKGVDKIEERDRHRWEFDPASSEDYQERSRRK